MCLIMTIEGWRKLAPKKCVPAPHDKTLLELHGLTSDDLSNQYCNSIKAFLRRDITLERCMSIMGSKRKLPNGGLPYFSFQ